MQNDQEERKPQGNLQAERSMREHRQEKENSQYHADNTHIQNQPAIIRQSITYIFISAAEQALRRAHLLIVSDGIVASPLVQSRIQ